MNTSLYGPRTPVGRATPTLAGFVGAAPKAVSTGLWLTPEQRRANVRSIIDRKLSFTAWISLSWMMFGRTDQWIDKYLLDNDELRYYGAEQPNVLARSTVGLTDLVGVWEVVEAGSFMRTWWVRSSFLSALQQSSLLKRAVVGALHGWIGKLLHSVGRRLAPAAVRHAYASSAPIIGAFLNTGLVVADAWLLYSVFRDIPSWRSNLIDALAEALVP